MKKYTLFPLILIVFLVVVSTQVHADLVSTFDSSAEGWTGDDPTYHDWKLISWQSTGGNPGGYIFGRESSPAGGTGYFMSPDTWDGNWSSNIGGTLKYDIKIFSGTSFFIDDDVRIYNGSNYISWRSGTTDDWSGWKTFELSLNAANFVAHGSDFNTILSDVTALWIRGEYINGSESEGLDNVKVAPIPLPGAVWLLGSGLVGLLGFRRFRKG